jgi:hypothetical protein
VTEFAIEPGSTLVFSADGGEWETVTFQPDDFTDPAAPSPPEIAAVIARTADLEAAAEDDGTVLVTSASVGSNATIEWNLGRSTAAGSVGLTLRTARASGEGLQQARLVSPLSEPFGIAPGAELVLVRNGNRRRVRFTDGFTASAATAAEVVALLNDRLEGVSRTTRDGRVMLRGRGVGPDSAVEVRPSGGDSPDAAHALGFVGADAISHPHRAEQAQSVLRSTTPSLAAVSLSATPIELDLPTGVTVLPPGGAVPLSPIEAADPQLHRLIALGAVRLAGVVDE